MNLRSGSGFRQAGHLWRVLVCCALLLSWAGAARAQDSASIIGQVTDESGGVLPGVTVTVTGPALQVPEMSAVTNERGEYRLTPLPIGTYQVVYALSGFTSVKRDGLRLTVGFVAKVDMVLKVGALEETVNVSGASPVVDVTTTNTPTVLTRETLELTPTGRVGWTAVLAQAPGVRGTLDIGGSSGGSPTYRAFGQAGDSWQTLEGVLTKSPKISESGNYFDFASVEEAQVQTVGSSADVPTRGIKLATLVKSGSNQLHGSTWWQHTSQSMQSNNIDDALKAQGITSGGDLQRRYMFNGDIGGRLIRDKLWFYGGYTGNRNRTEVLGATPQPDGSAAVEDQLYQYMNDKWSYQMSKANRFVGFQQWGTKRITREVTQFRPWEARSYQFLHGQTIKGEWQSIPTSSIVISAQAGIWQWHSPFYGFSPKVATMDTVTLYESGMNTTFAGEDPLERNYHTTGTFSWFKPELFAGNHEFKAGFDYVAALIGRAHVSRDAPEMWQDQDRPSPLPTIGDYRLLYRSGVPFQVQVYNFPVHPATQSHYGGLYVKDNWTIARRLTLDLGLRYAHDRGFVPPQCRDAGAFAAAQCFPAVNDYKIWNTVAPRAHAAFDVTGNGKSVIKGGWGRFDHKRLIDPEVLVSNKNIQISTTYTWHDLNNDKLYQPGEVNLDPNGVDFVSQAGQGNGAFANSVANPNELEPKENEYMVSFERELMPNFGVRVSGVYSKTYNNYALVNNLRPYSVYNIPVTNIDPGPDGLLATTADNGPAFTFYDYDVSLRGLKFEEGMLINDAEGDQTFKSIEFSASKRLANNYQFLISYAATKKNIPFPSARVADYNPNARINQLDDTTEWLADMSGAYIFPHDIMASVNYEVRSGNYFARQVLFSGGKQVPTQVLNVDLTRDHQLSTISHIDLRLEKRFALGQSGKKAAIRFNVYNATNANTTTGVTVRSGASYLKPSGILAPRIGEISASFNF